jgi:hypothetical protein
MADTKITIGFTIKGSKDDPGRIASRRIMDPDEKCSVCGKALLDHTMQNVDACGARQMEEQKRLGLPYQPR